MYVCMYIVICMYVCMYVRMYPLALPRCCRLAISACSSLLPVHMYSIHKILCVRACVRVTICTYMQYYTLYICTYMQYYTCKYICTCI